MPAWWYRIGENITGPVSATELKRLAKGGLLKPATLVKKKGHEKWVAAEKVRGLFEVADEGTTEPRPNAEPSPTPGASFLLAVQVRLR